MKPIDYALQEYIAILHKNADQYAAEAGLSDNLRYNFTAEPGSKYIKIVQATRAGMHRSVHSFVEKATANVFKPAGWRAPAKGVRYNLYGDMGLLTKVADPHGSYLYKTSADAAHA